jgi:hypothetical protein
VSISYNDVPLANQQIDQSQAPIRTNFNSISALIDVDHETFTDSKHGYHKALHIVDGVPSPALVAGEGSIYVDSNNVFIKNGTSAAVSLTDTTGSVGNGSYTLPNGLILKWGVTSNFAGNTTTTVTFPAAFPNNCFSVVCTGYQTSSGNQLITITAFTTAGFTAFNRQLIGGATAVPATYFAIGN